MNKRIYCPLVAFACAAVSTCTLPAKTLEFWSLEAGATPGTLDLSPTLNSSHKLNAWSASGTFGTCTPAFTGVPGNQEFTTQRNLSALTSFDQLRSLIASSDDLKTAAMLGNDFTFEGWFKLSTANNMWLFGTRTSKGWYFKWNKSGYFSFHCGTDNNLDYTCDTAKMSSTWTHIAFVWHHEGGDSGYGYCELFIDRELVATKSITAAPTMTAKDSFYIGGRGNGGSDFKGGKFAVDCVRFSDSALGAADLLTGHSLTDDYPTPSNPDVVAFWRMDETAPYTNSVEGGVSLSASRTTFCTTDEAAVTRIPNMEWSTWPESGDNYNHGALIMKSNYTSGTLLYAGSAVAKYLSLTNDFTVEGWFKMDAFPSQWKILTGVHVVGSPRWWVIIRNKQYLVMVQHSSGYTIGDNLAFTDGTQACTLTDDDLGKWRHHAIVFEKDKGAHGTFSIYIDGVYRGSRAQTADYPASASASLATSTFDIGGRYNYDNCFNGLGVDLVRVTRKALQPSEFLNAASTYHPPAVEAVTNAVVATKTRVVVTNTLDTASYVGCDRPFSLEGWVRVREAGAYPQTLAECSAGNSGWKLAVTNANTILLTARNGDGTTIAEKSFTLAKGDFSWWKHLEVSYNFGLWNFHVDTQSLGSVTNSSAFAANTTLPTLTFGSESGQVQHEQWRIVNRTLSVSEFDYRERPRLGIVILFR